MSLVRSILLTTILLQVSTVCSCSRPGKEPASALPKHEELEAGKAGLSEPLGTLSGDLTIIKNTSRLPGSCRLAFASLAKESKFEMAEPGEKFQAGDVGLFHLPWRRLVLPGISSKSCLIHYEKGGRGHSYYAVLFRVSPDGNATFLWGGAGFQTESDLEQMRADITNGKFRTLGKTETGW